MCSSPLSQPAPLWQRVRALAETDPRAAIALARTNPLAADSMIERLTTDLHPD